MKIIKKLFGGIDLTWIKTIIFAVLAGAYTALIAILPYAKDTSFANISIYFEVWILFGIIIITNSKSPLDSGLKCFVFFLISQPLVYLIQVPFTELGWGIFVYYRTWFIWTLFTFPMGFIGYFMKKDKWWGLLILAPILLLLSYHYALFLSKDIYFFPHHLLSTIFCAVTLLIYPVFIFDNKKIRITGAILSILIIIGMTVYTFFNRNIYSTTVFVSHGSEEVVFDSSYTAHLENESFGKVYIVYDEAMEEYMLNADFKRGGKTKLILEAPDGSKSVFDLDIQYSSFDVSEE